MNQKITYGGNFDTIPFVPSPIGPVIGNAPFNINLHTTAAVDRYVLRDQFQDYDPQFPIAWDGFWNDLNYGKWGLGGMGCASCGMSGLGAETPPKPVSLNAPELVKGSTQIAVIGSAGWLVLAAAALWLYKSGKK